MRTYKNYNGWGEEGKPYYIKVICDLCGIIYEGSSHLYYPSFPVKQIEFGKFNIRTVDFCSTHKDNEIKKYINKVI